MTLRTFDGRSFTSIVHTPKGAAALGIAWEDVEAKYRALVPHAGLAGQAMASSLQVIHNFRQVSHPSELLHFLNQ
ncbi:hypothetical protein LP414_08160 [Polaromonas sp. P1(28)-13]|nr:hypothetical protein LP414_08160 [Polaromonas sp. P1(28)-13]